MEAINNEVKRRIEEMNELRRSRALNPERMALSSILDDIIFAIDFQQRKVKRLFERYQEFSSEPYMNEFVCKLWHDWSISKAALTRLQQRYKIVLEMLMIK